MKCLTEIELELIVLDEKLGTEEVAPGVLEHLEKCAHCSERAAKLETFYGEFKKISSEPVSLLEYRFIQDIARNFSRWIYIAYPLSFKDTRQSVVGIPAVLAAASTDVVQLKPFQNLGVLTTQDGEILVRVIRTVKNSEITLHLISDHEQNYRNVLVSIPNVNKEYISDDNGKVHLGDLSLPETKDLLVKVQTPCASFDLTPLDIWGTEEVAQTEIVLTNERNDSIKVEFISSDLDYALKVHLLKIPSADNKRLRIMVTRGKRDPKIIKTKKGLAVFQGLKRNGELSIKVFD